MAHVTYNVLIVVLTVLVQLCCESNATLSFRRTSFQWNASLDCCTGKASSMEKSIFEPAEQELTLPTRHVTTKFAKNEFYSYPRFLEKVTLGLCRVFYASDDHSYKLCTRIFPINLLSFGKPIMKKEKNKNVTCVHIPVVGGLLAKLDPYSANNGCLRFALQQDERKITLLTEIAENYKPSLAGNKIPIPWWRSKLYCSTQRMFHEYVMFKYHGYVLKEFEKKCFRKV